MFVAEEPGDDPWPINDHFLQCIDQKIDRLVGMSNIQEETDPFGVNDLKMPRQMRAGDTIANGLVRRWQVCALELSNRHCRKSGVLPLVVTRR